MASQKRYQILGCALALVAVVALLSATSRTNLVEMRGEAREHIHPDAEHSLYVISGELTVHAGDLETKLQAGDYVSIPAGMKHGYTVATGKSALLISMDAPPYDPQKTVR